MTGHLAAYDGMSILIVDDNASNVALMAALVREQGLHRIHTETDARRVPRRLVEEDPDLVLLDLHMPYVDGHTLLGRSSASRPAATSPSSCSRRTRPVLRATGHSPRARRTI